MLPPTLGLVVSMSGDSPMTVTVSSIAPTASVRLMVSVVPTGRIKPLRSIVRKPGSLANLVASRRELRRQIGSLFAGNHLSQDSRFFVGHDNRDARENGALLIRDLSGNFRCALLGEHRYC